ncbi:hypothetical protein CKO32_17510 [Afifella marina DSM 2698]|nr:hypothetical protein [Afifella marina DSM 2698]
MGRGQGWGSTRETGVDQGNRRCRDWIDVRDPHPPRLTERRPPHKGEVGACGTALLEKWAPGRAERRPDREGGGNGSAFLDLRAGTDFRVGTAVPLPLVGRG